MNALQAINDDLTQLAMYLGIEWSGENQQDLVLDELTHIVAAAFGIEETT